VKIEMHNPQRQILKEIDEYRMSQKVVAATYGLILALGQEKEVDWAVVNAAIVARWSKSGLNRVKEMAWKFATAPTVAP
jgi:hypothetical protein